MRGNMPTVLVPYCNFVDEITVQDGQIIKGKIVVIPKGFPHNLLACNDNRNKVLCISV